jgi:hypothetical protein
LGSGFDPEYQKPAVQTKNGVETVVVKFEKATEAQQGYIQILSNDLCFDRRQRNAHLSEITGREIKFLDDLTKVEASQVINQLKEWKESH